MQLTCTIIYFCLHAASSIKGAFKEAAYALYRLLLGKTELENLPKRTRINRKRNLTLTTYLTNATTTQIPITTNPICAVHHIKEPAFFSIENRTTQDPSSPSAKNTYRLSLQRRLQLPLELWKAFNKSVLDIREPHPSILAYNPLGISSQTREFFGT